MAKPTNQLSLRSAPERTNTDIKPAANAIDPKVDTAREDKNIVAAITPEINSRLIGANTIFSTVHSDGAINALAINVAA